jgi:hypothetical protein
MAKETKKAPKKEAVKEEVVEVQEAPKKEAPKKEVEPFFEDLIQLSVYQNKVYGLLPQTKRVIVENIEGGDVYVDLLTVKFDAEALIIPGQSKEFKGVDKLFIGTASRPMLLIKQFDK